MELYREIYLFLVGFLHLFLFALAGLFGLCNTFCPPLTRKAFKFTSGTAFLRALIGSFEVFSCRLNKRSPMGNSSDSNAGESIAVGILALCLPRQLEKDLDKMLTVKNPDFNADRKARLIYGTF
jgi:hypothetical protein